MIKVIVEPSYWENVTVQTRTPEGDLLECNHAGMYEDLLDYGFASYERADWVDDMRLSNICDKCDWSELIEQEPEW